MSAIVDNPKNMSIIKLCAVPDIKTKLHLVKFLTRIFAAICEVSDEYCALVHREDSSTDSFI